MMYDPKTDDRTFSGREKTRAVLPIMGSTTETSYAMAYAMDVFKRLTGEPAEKRHHHIQIVGTEADQAMAYAKDMFRRLRGLPEQEPLGSNRRQDKVRQHRLQRPSRSGGRLRNAGRRHPHTVSTAETVSSSVGGFLLILTAIGRVMMRLTLLIRRSILEPYALRRRRRIAIAQLKALDDRLLADIGVQRNDIERTVDSMLAARRDDTVSPSTAPALSTEDCRHDLPRAA